MEKNDKKQTRNRRAKNGKKIHPKVSYTALNIFDDSGIKYSDALEEYALIIATNNGRLIAKQEIEKFKIQNLQDEIKEIEAEARNKVIKRQKQIKEAENNLNAIEKTLENYLAIESRNAERALDQAMQLIKMARKEAEGKKFGVEKVPLEALNDIAKNNNIKLVTLLAKIEPQVKKDWIDI